MEDWEKIIDSLDYSTNKTLDSLVASLGGISDKFYNKVIELTTDLKLNTPGKSVSSSELAANLKKVSRINARLDKLLKDSGYTKEISKFINSFDQAQKSINNYYSLIVTDYNPSNVLFDEIKKSNIVSTAEYLLNSGVNANFIEPVKKVLSNTVTGNGSYALLSKQLKDLILGNDELTPRLKSYVGQVSDDAIRQFQRSYIKAVSEDLGLRHYFYRGTQVRDSREFCIKHHGHYYTKEEVESWPNSPWQGMIKGTNATNIYIYVGGYRCSHTLLPVSKTIYDAKK